MTRPLQPSPRKNFQTIKTLHGEIHVDDLPNHCPFCHHKIRPQVFLEYFGLNIKELFMACPNEACKRSFIAYYQQDGGVLRFLNETTRGTILGVTFRKTITDISSSFSQIYNQSRYAEQEGLVEICGVGYRKALEFLIKDYSIANHPNDKDKIEKKMLVQCIKEYVTDDRIKSVATRAVWLGNDETHYVRKWEGKNLEDLKKLIDLTVHWIEMEALTKSFQLDMPE